MRICLINLERLQSLDEAVGNHIKMCLVQPEFPEETRVSTQHEVQQIFLFWFLAIFPEDDTEQLDLMGLESRDGDVLEEGFELGILHNLIKERAYQNVDEGVTAKTVVQGGFPIVGSR